jgi:predicted ATP-grasp superfamily ATP-dependent carboligase
MHILVFEYASGGGFAGRPVPPSLAREGAAMRAALVADLAAIGRHRVLVTADPRFPAASRRGIEVVSVTASDDGRLDSLVASVDAVWLIAPETNRCLERMAARIEAAGTRLLGPGADAIRRASDKGGLAGRLRRRRIPHPETRVLRAAAAAVETARDVGYPVVVKPARGAGCEGVSVVRRERELPAAIADARRAATGPLLLQRYIEGVPASVSLIVNERGAVPLSVNRQFLRSRQRRISYGGGRTPLDHRLAGRAAEVAARTCAALPGLRGYIGIDMVLTGSEAVAVEVNARLTTAYLGVRAAIDGNVAAMALAACDGRLPASIVLPRRVRFAASGRVAPA